MTNGFPAAKVSFPYKSWPQVNEAFMQDLNQAGDITTDAPTINTETEAS